nr:hypothetical protein [uncultured Holophaga sp.]
MRATIVQAFKDIIRQLLTGKDNQTHDIARYAWAISTAAVLAHDAWQLHQGQPVNVRDLAEALAIVAAAFGLAIHLKRGSEPDGGAQ